VPGAYVLAGFLTRAAVSARRRCSCCTERSPLTASSRSPGCGARPTDRSLHPATAQDLKTELYEVLGT